MSRRDWFMCSKCLNQGWVLPNGTPDPNWGGGCSCEGINGLAGTHDWQDMKYNGHTIYKNHETNLLKYPAEYFDIS